MSAPDPNATAMKLKFTEFTSLDDTTVEFALEEAKVIIGGNTTRVRALLIMYLTAHILSVARIGQENGGLSVRHDAIGRLSTTYVSAGETSHTDLRTTTIGDLSTTTYGRRYQQLLQSAGSGSPFKTIPEHTRHHHG